MDVTKVATRPLRKLVALGLVCAVVVAVPITGAASGGSQVTGGQLAFQLSALQQRALDNNHVRLEATGAATFAKEALTLPIRSGTAMRPDYVVKVAGGFKFTSAGSSVKMTKLVFHITEGRLSRVRGRIAGGRRCEILKYAYQHRGGSPGDAQLTWSDVNFSNVVIAKLDRALSTRTFNLHQRLGPGSAEIMYGVA